MKTPILSSLFAVGLFLAAVGVRAADTVPVKSVQFKDGKLHVVLASGKSEVATNEVTMPEQVKVMTNGTFTVGAGKPRKLLAGQTLGDDGNLTSSDGSVVPVADHAVMKNGRLMVVRDGESTPATTEITLGDNSRVKPDGTVAGADGRLRRMLDGQITKFSGVAIPSTDTVMMKDGQVVLYKDGGRLTLRKGQTMMMSDGSKVFSDGTVLRADGKKEKVKDGEILKLPGSGAPNR